LKADVNGTSGFGEAAVKLQQKWMTNPEALPYSDTVKEHALVILIQKGLQYCELEQELKVSCRAAIFPTVGLKGIEH
jgi:hypothetical protein